jgi:hypothetical protein
MGRFGLTDERPPGLDSPATAKLIKYMAKIQVRMFRLTNGRIGSKWRVGAGFRKPVPTLLLDHVGRKSGNTFTTPLLYLEDGPNLLVASPETTVRIKREGHRPVRAQLWPRLIELYADFAKYAAWTDREIPVVVLEPR